MSSTKSGDTIVVETSRSDIIYSVVFHPDARHVFSGSESGVRQWRVIDGQEVGKHMKTGSTYAISLSRDGKWIVCGTSQGASVWDARSQDKVVDVEGAKYVTTVDISSDSARFATGTGINNKDVNIWDIFTGQRLVGPLQHDGYIEGVRFSLNGEHLAVAVRERSIHILDSRDGDQLMVIEAGIPRAWMAATPIAWSDNGQQIFSTSRDDKIKVFDVSSGSQLAESPVQNREDMVSIALAANGKFLTTFANRCVSFWNTSTFTQTGAVIEDSEMIRSISLSPDCNYLATGGFYGRVTIRSLDTILSDLPVAHGLTQAPPQGDHQLQLLIADVHDKPQSSNQHTTSISLKTLSEKSEIDLLEVEIPTPAPAPLFDYDEPPSPISATDRPEMLTAPDSESPSGPGSLHDTQGISEATSREATPNLKEHRDASESAGDIPVVKRWLRKVKVEGNKSHPSEAPAEMATGQRVRRVVATSVKWHKSNFKPFDSDSVNDASRCVRGPICANEAQQVNLNDVDTSPPSIASSLPAWMSCNIYPCCSSGTVDGTH